MCPSIVWFAGLIFLTPKSVTEGIISDVAPALQGLPKGGLPNVSGRPAA